jgi:hypothetical protein
VTLIGVKNLPKRAQREIARLQEEVASWKAKALAVASADPDATNVVLHGNVIDPDRGLPPDSRIVFRVGGRSFEVHPDGDSISIRGLDSAIVVYPSVSNVIRIKADR